VAPAGGSLGTCALNGELEHGECCTATCAGVADVLPMSCSDGILAFPLDCCPKSNGVGWNGEHEGVCELCPLGTSDADLDPGTPCVACAAGRFTDATGTAGTCPGHLPRGHLHVPRCVAGTYSVLGSTSASDCKKCHAGQVDLDALSSTPCTHCVGGTYSALHGATACVAVSSGMTGLTACAGPNGNGDPDPGYECMDSVAFGWSTCEALVTDDHICGTFCNAQCGPDWQAADASHDQCNAWTLTAHEDGWGDATLHIEDEDGVAQIAGFAYADDDWVTAGQAGVCLHPARCYRITVEGSATARWSLHDASGVLVAEGAGPTEAREICHCGHNGGDACLDCAGLAAPVGGDLGTCSGGGALAHDARCLFSCGGEEVQPVSCWNGVLASPLDCCPKSNGVGWNGEYDGVCEVCPVGQVDRDLDPGTPCVACAPGRFANTTGAAGSCPGECAKGTYSGSQTTSDCVACPPGTSDADLDPGTPCMACVPGRFADATGAVGTCPGACATGSYSEALGSTTTADCMACPLGTSDADLDPGTPCVACAPGRFANATGTAGTCSGECVAGTYSGWRATCQHAGDWDLHLIDYYGDGWNGHYWKMTDCAGNPIHQTTVLDGSGHVEDLCLDVPADGFAITVGGGYECDGLDEVSWELRNAAGEVVHEGHGAKGAYPCTDADLDACGGEPCTAGADGNLCQNSGVATGTSLAFCGCNCMGTSGFSGANCEIEPCTVGTDCCMACSLGTSDADLDSGTPCAACAPGRFANATGTAGTCPGACEMGTYSGHEALGSTTTADCMACPLGTSDADLDPGTPCAACAPGRFANATGTAGTCSGECAAGTYSGWRATCQHAGDWDLHLYRDSSSIYRDFSPGWNGHYWKMTDCAGNLIHQTTVLDGSGHVEDLCLDVPADGFAITVGGGDDRMYTRHMVRWELRNAAGEVVHEGHGSEDMKDMDLDACGGEPCTAGADGNSCQNSGVATGMSLAFCGCNCTGTSGFSGANCEIEPCAVGADCCVMCPPGTSDADLDPRTPCAACESGSFSNMTAALECVTCSVGQFAFGTRNVKCYIAGWFADADGSALPDLRAFSFGGHFTSFGTVRIESIIEDTRAWRHAGSVTAACIETVGTGSGTDHAACAAVVDLDTDAACVGILTDDTSDAENALACTYAARVDAVADVAPLATLTPADASQPSCLNACARSSVVTSDTWSHGQKWSDVVRRGQTTALCCWWGEVGCYTKVGTESWREQVIRNYTGRSTMCAPGTVTAPGTAFHAHSSDH
jgi:hypothetical protein